MRDMDLKLLEAVNSIAPAQETPQESNNTRSIKQEKTEVKRRTKK